MVLAAYRAPGRRKCLTANVADDAEAPPLSEAEDLVRVLVEDAEKSRKLARADALKVSVDVATCECGGKRRRIVVIAQAQVIPEIMAHLGLPTEVVFKETQPVWRARGPSGELFPDDVGETGQDLAVDDDFGMEFVDQLRVDEAAAESRGRGAGAEYAEAQTRSGLADRDRPPWAAQRSLGPAWLFG
ncbi:MAG: hypothetical protein HY902_06320 [Deltaproteobacteria bacterium]|nr:hypothetical protein [Deltaproteobacteria bacterium]